MIIPHWQISVKEYQANFLALLVVSDMCCPICGCPVHAHAWYLRVLLPDGETVEILLNILRVICTNKNCGRTHAILPEFIDPYCKHEMSGVQGVLQLTEQEGHTVTSAIALPPICEAESMEAATSFNTKAKVSQWICQNIGTAINWIKRFRAKAATVAGRLRQLLANAHHGIFPLKEPDSPWDKITWLINQLAVAGNIIITSPLIFSEVNRFLSTVAEKGNDRTFL
jgi:hypothetical protein